MAKKKEQNDKEVKSEKMYKAQKEKADKVFALNVPLEKMSISQLNIILASLKRSRADGAIPKKKPAMIATYHKWKHRPPPVFAIDESLINDDDINSSINNAAINIKAIASPEAV